MQVLLIVGQMFPFDNREHDNAHVGGPELLENPVTKELKVPGVFDIYLAPGWATNMFWKKHLALGPRSLFYQKTKHISD
jgi:hypothetical protein